MKKVSTDTIIRTIVLVIALVNQILTSLGKNPLPFSEDTLYELLTLFVTIVASAWAWWKNNSFTSAAIEADKVLKELKSGGDEITEEFQNGDVEEGE